MELFTDQGEPAAANTETGRHLIRPAVCPLCNGSGQGDMPRSLCLLCFGRCSLPTMQRERLYTAAELERLHLVRIERILRDEGKLAKAIQAEAIARAREASQRRAMLVGELDQRIHGVRVLITSSTFVRLVSRVPLIEQWRIELQTEAGQRLVYLTGRYHEEHQPGERPTLASFTVAEHGDDERGPLTYIKRLTYQR